MKRILMPLCWLVGPVTLAGAEGMRVEVGVDGGEVEVRAEGEDGHLFRVERSADGRRGGWSEVFFGERANGVVTYRERWAGVPGRSGLFRVASGPKVSAVTETYHGWDGAVRISNGLAEVVVVPSIARIMQFQLTGDADGPFWENRRLDGRPVQPGSWVNLGGDKVWPSPQSDFSVFTGRSWPPPAGFDATAAEVRIEEDGALVVMAWPEDAEYGVTVVRELRLLPLEPVMEVVTRYTRTSTLANNGHRRKIAAWVITQVDDGEGMYLPVLEGSRWRAAGYSTMSGSPGPANVSTADGLIRVKRSTTGGFKIGSDTNRILSVYDDVMLLMETPLVPGGEYSRNERFSVSQVYSNGGTSEPYLEMEFHSPWEELAVGESVELEVRYELMARRGGTAEEDARAVLLGGG